ncbi:protein kinase catalytic domain family protein [Babesia bovis T2Bo]|uniref:protein kinase catalytic domain family protein n=1 Tax=Babesia bovis T2Bo TaxID=484906 RepID=UPI001DDBB16A|nr:protein kinase catalytic domain family protein [Babesia bovis T2Bo]EDO07206.2 protein kinase catalytic domain family protein [Babesia bovis T2Bo]
MLKYITGKSPISFTSSGIGYTEEEPVESPFGRLQSYVWYNSKSKTNDTLASLFKFSLKNREPTGNNIDQEFAERHLQGIKIIVHPNVLKVLKVKQNENGITIATERCYPLSTTTISTDPALGFAQIISAVSFLHNKCNKAHCLISPNGVVVREDGSWCLTSFECTVDHNTSVHRVLSELKWHAIWHNGWKMPVSTNAFKSVKQLDLWGIGALMCWVYALISGQMDMYSIRRDDCDILSLKRFVPANLRGLIDQLMSPNCDVDLEQILRTHPYFANNTAVIAMDFVMELHIKTEDQTKQFFEQLPAKLPQIPTDIACKQLLPEMLKAISIHKALVPQILVSVVAICKSLIKDEFKSKVYPHICQLFKEPDRAIRYSILKLMPDLDPLLDEDEVSNNLLEPLLIGFGDVASQIRDETVKAMVYVMKKIKKRQQHHVAMLLFKCAEDCEPTIRVNTIICFAKIIPFVQQELVDKVVPQVWRVGLNDNFLKSRIATLESISASHGFFSVKQKVGTLLPLACNTLLDEEPEVRRLGIETVYAILESLKGHIYSGGSTRQNQEEKQDYSPISTQEGLQTYKPMNLGGTSPNASNMRQNIGFGSPIKQQSPSRSDPWALNTRSHKNTEITQQKNKYNDNMDDFDDFFDPFPAKH